MSACVLVTVNLHEAPPERRRDFCDRMAGRGWLGFAEVTGSYWREFDADGASLEVAAVVSKQIEDSAKEAGVAEWSAVCMPSVARPITL